jgi:phage major head subunit gpT-like protein
MTNKELPCSRCEKVELLGCFDTDCPVQLNLFSSNITTPISNIFEVESLDPDKRTWYYDGNGTKRKKGDAD